MGRGRGFSPKRPKLVITYGRIGETQIEAACMHGTKPRDSCESLRPGVTSCAGGEERRVGKARPARD